MRKITERTPRNIRYGYHEPIAILSLTAFSAIVVFQPDEFDVGTCDFVVADLYDDCIISQPRRVRTHVDGNGKLYFYRHGRLTFLDEFIRI